MQVDVLDVPCYASVHYRKTILFGTRKTLSIEQPSAKPLKTCLKDDSNKYFVVIKY